MFGDATYISPSSGLFIRDHFEGEVEIIIGEVINWGSITPPATADYDGIMIGPYTQWSYAYAESGDLETLDLKYPGAVLAPDIGPYWWSIGHTEYIAHRGE